MRIEIDTETTGATELTAVIALCLALGGTAPAAGVMPEVLGAQVAPLPPTTTAAQPDPAGDDTQGDDEGPADGSIDPTKADSTGVPWDARIHSTPPKLNKDLSYRSKRGVSEVEFGRIHGELAEAYAAGNAGRAAPPPPSGGSEGAASATGAAATSENPAPLPPSNGSTADNGPSGDAGNPAPPPPTGQAAGTESARTEAPSDAAGDATAGSGISFENFGAFVAKVNGARAGGIPYLELNTYANTLGVAGGFKDMKDYPDKWADFYALVGGV